MENQAPAPQHPQNPAPQDELSPKMQEIQQKKARFQRLTKIVGAVLLGLILLTLFAIGGRVIYQKNIEKFTKTIVPEDGAEIVIKEPEDETPKEELETFSNEKFKFSFEYPKLDTVLTDEEQQGDSFVKILYKEIVPAETPTGSNLIKGYIFEVNPLRISARNIRSVTQVKKEFFEGICPSTASFTEIEDRTVDGKTGLGFDIFNCNSDYSITYVPANDLMYEVIQTLKGDVGFKQVFKSQTNLLQESLKIQVDPPNLDPFVLYDSTQLGLMFEYPRELDIDCCSVPPPPAKTTVLLTVAEGDNDHAMALYSTRDDRLNFDSFFSEQKQLLIDDYTVIKGRAPEGTQTELQIGGYKAYMLEGFSWKENTLVYVPLPTDDRALIISRTGLSDENFNSILNSIKITDER